MEEFAGKVALVTGSSKEIGKSIAIGLAKKGADIVINYFSDKQGAIDTKKKVENLGRTAIIVKADVGNFKEVNKMFDLLYKEFGKIDILVNNAAIAIWKLFENFSEEDWDITINTNLKSIFMCTKLSIPYMKKNGGGTIINIGSLAGYGYLEYLVPYCASKGGVNLITKALAVEFAKYNIRVNCVCPGTIAVKKNFKLDQKFPDNWLPYIPQGRIGLAEDIADMVTFLCSEKSSYITGQIIYVDGGVSCYIPMPRADFVK